MFHRLQLRELAKQEYEQARGTAHKLLLHAAIKLLRLEMKRLASTISSARHQKNVINLSYHQALEKALVQIIVHEHLQDVPGIGAQRKVQILQHIFQGRLSDLSHAYQLQGVGQQTQQALNAWIASYQRQLPVLLKGNFSGRGTIDQKYQPKIEKIEQQLVRLIQLQKTLETKIARIAKELKWLNAITQKDFYSALKDPRHPSPTLNLYVQGVFGEWEPMPDWFREAINNVEPVQSSISTDVEPRGNQSAKSEEFEPDIRPKRVRKWLIRGCLATSSVTLFCFVSILLIIFLTPDANIEGLSSPTAMPATVVVTSPPQTPTGTSFPLPTETTVPTASDTPLPTATAIVTATAVSQVRIVATVANLREGPGTDFSIIGTLFENDQVTFLDQTADGFWYQVRLEDDSTGWIGSSVARIEQIIPPESDE